MGETPKSLLNEVNRSGFLFQMRIEHEVKQTQRQHGWAVLSHEHRWEDTETHEEGFIDLVLEHENFAHRMVVECKRVGTGTTWVFLVPEASTPTVQPARLLWTYTHLTEWMVGWDDLLLAPPTPESALCVVRGQNKKSPPMLERLAGILLRSTECLAKADPRISKASPLGREGIYIPLIVTTAELQVCRFDSASIGLHNGELALEDARFEPVSCVRFRKSLSSNLPPTGQPTDLAQTNLESERTVLVANASALASMLESCRIERLDWHKPWPWETVA